VIAWHPNQIHLPIFNTLHFTFNVGGEEVPYNLIQVIYDTPRGTLTFGKIITTFYESMQLDSGEHNTPGSSNTLSNSIPCVFPTTLSLWGTNSPRRRKTRLETY
jgi:hypothetical protein